MPTSVVTERILTIKNWCGAGSASIRNHGIGIGAVVSYGLKMELAFSMMGSAPTANERTVTGMADVIIKGMEKMPHRCRECFAVQLWDEMDYCRIAERWQPWNAVARPDWCPLNPAPEREHPITSNSDHIRAMSDEELAAWLDELVEHNWLDWLKQEVDSDPT